eukprot:TRINITY_DN6061_c0_g1_i9.p1 TRINITY_DN6061_c0_g1~~TRINITY_DN6061_c0_g1_i9.p1  ORF type:complete len:123 (-),score=6.46 TRINITY_DN6061_c0_g1_i9:19-387(-)
MTICFHYSHLSYTSPNSSPRFILTVPTYSRPSPCLTRTVPACSVSESRSWQFLSVEMKRSLVGREPEIPNVSRISTSSSTSKCGKSVGRLPLAKYPRNLFIRPELTVLFPFLPYSALIPLLV